jgi:hypothetical protein
VSEDRSRREVLKRGNSPEKRAPSAFRTRVEENVHCRNGVREPRSRSPDDETRVVVEYLGGAANGGLPAAVQPSKRGLGDRIPTRMSLLMARELIVASVRVVNSLSQHGPIGSTPGTCCERNIRSGGRRPKVVRCYDGRRT